MFRSQGWLRGDDEVAMLHRVALRSAGVRAAAGDSRPLIGIADSSSQLNPCNAPLRPLVDDVAAGITEAGGLPVAFPVMSLGEDLMKPTAMVYRNLLAMEVEEYLRSYPLDGVVLMANCDKSIPGALMGALSFDLPVLMLTAGPRPAARFRGRSLGAGTDVWRMLDERSAGTLDDDGWRELEDCLTCGQGACNVMGTACTMALLVEALGLSLPGSSLVEAGSADRRQVAVDTGRAIVSAVESDRRPSRFLDDAAFANAVKVLHAVGGSTNAVIHLLALAGRAGVALSLREFDVLGRNVPLLSDVEPSGSQLIDALAAEGGLPALLHGLKDHFDVSKTAGDGRSWDACVTPPHGSAGLRRDPVANAEYGAIAVVHGSLAPTGAVIKVSAASTELLEHRGRAVVFTDYDRMRRQLADPDFEVLPDAVLVFSGAGPVGGPGMPEWGMIPMPASLLRKGIRDIVRVSDARMSGTSFGTCVLHVTPEAAVGGPLGRVQDGDEIELSVSRRVLDLHVSESELSRRPTPCPRAHERGWLHLYAREVQQADLGCDFAFLRRPEGSPVNRDEPTIGRS